MLVRWPHSSSSVGATLATEWKPQSAAGYDDDSKWKATIVGAPKLKPSGPSTEHRSAVCARIGRNGVLDLFRKGLT